jgi:hypothetical protein
LQTVFLILSLLGTNYYLLGFISIGAKNEKICCFIDVIVD